MKNLGSFKSVVLISAVALSVLSSPASAVSQKTVNAYWRVNSATWQTLDKDALNKLKELDRTQWIQFKRMVNSLASGMGKYDSGLVITALASISPEKWDEFKTITEALTPNMDGKNRAQVVNALGGVPADKLSDPNFISTVKEMTEKMDGYNCAWVIKASGGVPADKLSDPNFISIAKALTENMDGKNRAWVISSLGQLPSDKLADPDFISIAKALTENMDGKNRAWVISSLAKFPDDKLSDLNFIPKIKAMTAKMDEGNRASASLALLQVPVGHREKFMTIAESLTENMDGLNRTLLIAALGGVKENHKNPVYSQLQRFVEETTGKMHLKSSSAGENLIRLYPYCDTEDRAIAFTTDLIARVKGAPGTVNNADLTIYMQSAWCQRPSEPLYQFPERTGKRKKPVTNSSVEEVNGSASVPSMKRRNVVAPGSYDE